MTAKEQFYNRMAQFDGVVLSWQSNRKNDINLAAVETENEIILFNYDEEQDKYREIHYPTFKELCLDNRFVDKCLRYFSEVYDGDNFLTLYEWLEGISARCPLLPIDAFYTASHRITYYNTFNDESTLPKAIKDPEVTKIIQSIVKKFAKEPVAQSRAEQEIIALLKVCEDKNADSLKKAFSEILG